MTTNSHYRLNDATATGKVIEDEAVLINVVTGRYYSLTDASCVAWVVLSGGGSVDEASDAIAERYEVNGAAVREDVAALVAELVEEELLVLTESGQSSDPRAALPPPGTNGTREAYRAVSLETFRDMEELLAFDPPLPQVPGQFSELRPG